jgi:uncharacterized protein YdaU (DUF1376 family)
MTLSFIGFHMGDYQRDTQQLPLEGHGAYFLLLQHCWTHGHIPLDDDARAAICKVPVQRWRKQLAPLVSGYFDANGENKRATAEIAKAEKLRLRQSVAGHKGGLEATKRKAARKENISAMAQPRSSGGQAMAEPRSSHGEATKKERDITSTFVGAARASENPTKSPEMEPNEANRVRRSAAETESQAANPAATPQGLAKEAREAVQKSAGSIGSGELIASIQAKHWVKP